MSAIYSSVALRDRQREVKERARHEVVHITENGNGAFVFCSEVIFAEQLEKAREEAVYEERMAQAIREGRADVAAGRVYKGVEAAFAEIERRRSDG